MKEYALLCVYSDICHQHFDAASSYYLLFECLATFWCFTALIITVLITEHTKKELQFHKCGSCSLKHKILSDVWVSFDRRDP